MTLIGIDYGTKRVGVAICEESIAFPLSVIPNTPNLINELKKIAEERKANVFVIGESKNYKGEDNEVMGGIRELEIQLEGEGFEVHFEPEFMTSAEAVHIQGENEMIDASAAAIILQSFLNKKI